MNNSIRVLEGGEGIREAYEETLRSKRLDIQCLSSRYEDIIGDYFDKNYAPRLFKSGITTREILPDTKENREYAKKKDGKKNQVVLLPNVESESDFIITDDSIVLISYSNNPYAVIISDQELLSLFQGQFDLLWKYLQSQ